MADTELTPGQLAVKVQVTQITKQRGYLPEVYATIEPETRRIIERTVLQVDKEHGPATLALVDGLYAGNSVNPIPELLDNAFSSSYKKATEHGDDPYVSFELFHDRLVVEYNEDGFTSDDLQSICSVGRGSRKPFYKKNSLGFKSVFTVAWKAHIRSNDLSFNFTHRKGDSGLGLISPIWQDPTDILKNSLTRITLFLGTQEESGARELAYDTIASQLNEICHTTLLDDIPIKRISISTYTAKKDSPSTTAFFRHGNNPVVVKKESVFEGVESIDERRYHIFHHRLQKVPRSENLVYRDKDSQPDAPSLLTLVFCLDGNSAPVQLRPLNFSCITSWDEDASGRALRSKRNEVLQDKAAEALIKAIQHFCLHPTLRFRWMRWLPQPDNQSIFGLELIDKIKPLLKPLKIFQTYSGQLVQISKLRCIKTIYDNDGNPLFGESILLREIYSAKEYKYADLRLLKAYGLRQINWEETVELVEMDLVQPQSRRSRMKNPETTQEWHTREAQTLMNLYTTACKPETPQRLKKFKSLCIVPLKNGRWVSSDSGPLYSSRCLDQLSIPDNLGYNIVDPKACENNNRRKLFDSLGVTDLNFEQVRSRILSPTGPNSISATQKPSLQSTIDGLVFLYESDMLKESGKSHESLRSYCVFDQNWHACSSIREDLYLSSPDSRPPETSPETTLQSLRKVSNRFLHPQYLANRPRTPPNQQMEWSQWLQCVLGLASGIQITQPDSTGDVKLSHTFQYLVKYWPDRIVDVLRTTWPDEGKIIQSSPKVLEKLRTLNVPSTNGTKYPLSGMYLSVLEFEKHFSRHRDNEDFPFLDVAVRSTAPSWRSQWEFLIDFLGVRCLPSLGCYLSSLLRLSLAQEYGASEIAKMLDLCESIQEHCKISKDPRGTKDNIRQFFRDNELKLMPKKKIQWAATRFSSSLPLSADTNSPLYRSHKSWEMLLEFYTSTLEIRDENWNDLLDELRRLSKSNTTSEPSDFDWITEVYSILTRLWAELSPSDRESLRRSFVSEELVYIQPSAGKSKWCAVGSCLWSNISLIQGKNPLVDLYPQLQEFFVDILNVPKLNLHTLCDKITENGLGETLLSVWEAKRAIWEINELFKSTKARPDPKPFREIAIFPVKYPGVAGPKLRTAATDFLISDRKDACEFRVRILDFTVNEVRQLEPLFKWLKLEGRFFSSVVEEVSAVLFDNKTELQDIDRGIKGKAHELLRFAVHFDSPRSRKNEARLIQVLRDIKVYETDTIISTLSLNQGGQKFSYVKKQSKLHIQEDPSCKDALKIFVPRDPQRQQLSYLLDFPRRFLDWLMTDPASSPSAYMANEQALRTLTSMLNAPSALVPRILDEEGIMEVYLPANSKEKYEDESASKSQYADAPITPQKEPPPSKNFKVSSSSGSILGSHSKEPQCQQRNPRLSPSPRLEAKLPSRSTKASPVPADPTTPTPVKGFVTPSPIANWPATPPRSPPNLLSVPKSDG